MGCEVCEPLLNGVNWSTEIESGHADQSQVVLSKVMEGYKLVIYPKPYKAHKFWGTHINYCPYCGEHLKSGYEVVPKLIKE